MREEFRNWSTQWAGAPERNGVNWRPAGSERLVAGLELDLFRAPAPSQRSLWEPVGPAGHDLGRSLCFQSVLPWKVLLVPTFPDCQHVVEQFLPLLPAVWEVELAHRVKGVMMIREPFYWPDWRRSHYSPRTLSSVGSCLKLELAGDKDQAMSFLLLFESTEEAVRCTAGSWWSCILRN